MKIDVVIIATRRVDLLRETLESFSKHVFPFFEINTAIVNIDPIWGGKSEHEEIRSILAENFDNLKIIEPVEPNFCRAVKSAWSQTTSDVILHLEEDWIALEDIKPDLISSHLDEVVTSLSFMHSNKNWNGKQVYHYRRYRPWYLPFKIEDKRKPYFGTSPSFWNGKFLRECAVRLDVNFDPEKQFYSDVNDDLQKFVKNKKCKFLLGKPYLVEDIGRDWQLKNKVSKEIKYAQSHWI